MCVFFPSFLFICLQALDQQAENSVPGAESLQLSPPLWNEQGQMFQLAFEAVSPLFLPQAASRLLDRTNCVVAQGRACCMSNKNVQLVSDRFTTLPTLQVLCAICSRAWTGGDQRAAFGFLLSQVGKLRKNLFNVDLAGYISPYQAFAIALSIFDQSSVRRRF